MRYLRFTNWLTEIDRLSGPVTAIWFEEVRRHAATDAAHVYGGLMATLTAWAELRGIPYEGVPVGTIKRHATGKGNANKDAMMAPRGRAASRPPTTTRPTPSRSCSGRWRPGRCAMSGMRFTPKGYGGHRRNPDEVKRDGWKEQGLLAVAVDDDRLTWPERELVRQLGERLYGKREREARHG